MTNNQMKSNFFYGASEFFKGLTINQKLLLIIGLGLAMRLYVVLNAVTLSVDSFTDLALAKAFAEGDFWKGIDISRPPVHPFLVSLVYHVFGDLELSARIVALVFGTLVIPLGFYLGRLVYNERLGLLAAFFVAIHPYLVRYSGETLREALYHFFAALLVILGIKAVFNRSISLMFLVGVVSVLAYLTKHASIGFFIMICLWVVFYEIRGIRKDWHKRALLLASGMSVFILVALPYLFFLFQETGGATVTGKISLSSVWASATGTIGFANDHLIKFLKRVPEAFSIPFFLLFLWYLLRRWRDNFSREEKFLLSLLLAYFILHLLQLPQRRYLIRLMPIGVVFAAMGFHLLSERLRLRYREKTAAIATIILVLITAVQVPKGLTSLHAHRMPERQAGEWILETRGPGTTILSRKPISAHYADARHVIIYDGWNLARIVEYGKNRGATYVAGYPSKLEKEVPDFEREKERLLVELKTFKSEGVGKELVLYGFAP